MVCEIHRCGQWEKETAGDVLWSPGDKNEGLGLGSKLNLKDWLFASKIFCIIYVIIYFTFSCHTHLSLVRLFAFLLDGICFFQAHEAALLLSLRAKQMTSLVQNQITQFLDA